MMMRSSPWRRRSRSLWRRCCDNNSNNNNNSGTFCAFFSKAQAEQQHHHHHHHYNHRPTSRWQSTVSSTISSTVQQQEQEPNEVTIVEVGPRDGLQNEKGSHALTVQQRVQFVELLAQAGCRHIEVGSFVSSQWVPAMAQSNVVYQALVRDRQRQQEQEEMSLSTCSSSLSLPSLVGTTLSCLVPNVKGMEQALQSQVEEIAIFAAASETFSQKNINCSVDESMERYREIIDMARQQQQQQQQQHQNQKIAIRGYLSCVVACPYEGPIDPKVVAERTAQLLDMGCYQVSLGDTIGVATAATTRKMLNEVVGAVGSNHVSSHSGATTAAAGSATQSSLAVHFHDTYGQAVANTLVALDEYNIRCIDASVAGLGGCPYAPGAAGNLATEDIVYLMNGLGCSTNIDLNRLVDAADYVMDILQRPSRSKVGLAIGAKRAMQAKQEEASSKCV